MAVISAMDDYADKKNNQGAKNIILAALIAILSTIALAVIGYLANELVNLRAEKDALAGKVIRLEMRQSASDEEQNRMVFQLLEGMAGVGRVKPVPQPGDDEDDDHPPVGKVPPDERFRDYHRKFEQRVQDRLPPEQMKMEEK